MEFGCLKGVHILSYDNFSSIQLVNNLVHHTRTKHTIELQHHYIKKRWKLGETKIKYKPMSQQHANLLFKPLEKIRFQSFRIHVDIKDHSHQWQY
jgi:hypothetical protein